MNLKQDFFSKLFITFVFAGGLAAAVNFLAGIFFRQYFNYTISVALAFPCGLSTAYLLNRLFVFGRGDNSQSVEVFYFVIVNLFALIITYSVSLFLYEYFFPLIKFDLYRAELSHLAGIAAPVFTSFVGHKYLTFWRAQPRHNGSSL